MLASRTSSNGPIDKILGHARIERLDINRYTMRYSRSEYYRKTSWHANSIGVMASLKSMKGFAGRCLDRNLSQYKRCVESQLYLNTLTQDEIC